MSQDSITLCQNPPIQFNDWDVGCRIHFRDPTFLVLRVLLEAVADVIVCYAGIFPEETDDLATATGLEVEVVKGGDAADGLVSGRFRKAALCGWHFERMGLLVCLCRMSV